MVSVELVITSFLTVMLIASFISHRLKLPYTLVLVVVGILLTALSPWSFLAGPFQSDILAGLAGIHGMYSQLLSGPTGGLFIALVIPPLIFEAMMHVSPKDLKEVIKPALALATVGVALSTVVGGLALWLIFGLPFYVSFIFAALISPTDAATVVSVFKHARVPSKLSALLDTEAALNDATAIVIFSIVATSIASAGLSLASSIEQFAVVFGGGVGVGLAVALLAELAGAAINEKLSRITLTIFAVYGSYTFAEALGVSGLVAVSIVGIYYGSVAARSSVGPSTREGVVTFWEIAAFIGNSVAFLFVGFETDLLSLVGALALVGVAYGAVLVARFASVYPILAAFNRFGGKIPSSWRNVAMLGGMRGAVSVSLVVSLPVSAAIGAPELKMITTMVLGVAFVSISAQAWALSRYVRGRFPAKQEDALGVRLSKVTAAIEALERLQTEGKVTTEVFTSELEKEKDDLRELLAEINHSVGTKDILKSRADTLYSSVLSLPMSRAMAVLRRNKMAKPIDDLVKKTSGEDDDGEGAK